MTRKSFIKLTPGDVQVKQACGDNNLFLLMFKAKISP
jgi:hypothetical protein